MDPQGNYTLQVPQMTTYQAARGPHFEKETFKGVAHLLLSQQRHLPPPSPPGLLFTFSTSLLNQKIQQIFYLTAQLPDHLACAQHCPPPARPSSTCWFLYLEYPLLLVETLPTFQDGSTPPSTNPSLGTIPFFFLQTLLHFIYLSSPVKLCHITEGRGKCCSQICPPECPK